MPKKAKTRAKRPVKRKPATAAPKPRRPSVGKLESVALKLAAG